MSAKPLILVVEGKLANQMLVRTLLESAGYEVEVVKSAAQALASLAKASLGFLALSQMKERSEPGVRSR